MAVIAPLASADDNKDKSNNDKCHDEQSHHDDQNNKDKCQSDNEDNDEDESGTVSNTNPGNPNTPITVYTHLDVGTCTTNPITSVLHGWCPDGFTTIFFIPDSGITQYSVIALTTVPPVTTPLSTIQCIEQTINYKVGADQGFGIICNYPPLPGSGLNYVVFNPSQSWADAHNKNNNNNNNQQQQQKITCC